MPASGHQQGTVTQPVDLDSAASTPPQLDWVQIQSAINELSTDSKATQANIDQFWSIVPQPITQNEKQPTSSTQTPNLE